jgi:hypothetical protein
MSVKIGRRQLRCHRPGSARCRMPFTRAAASSRMRSNAAARRRRPMHAPEGCGIRPDSVRRHPGSRQHGDPASVCVPTAPRQSALHTFYAIDIIRRQRSVWHFGVVLAPPQDQPNPQRANTMTQFIVSMHVLDPQRTRLRAPGARAGSSPTPGGPARPGTSGRPLAPLAAAWVPRTSDAGARHCRNSRHAVTAPRRGR